MCSGTAKTGSVSLQIMKVHGTTFKGNYRKVKLWLTVFTLFILHFSILRGRKLSKYPGLAQFCEDLFSKQIRSPFLLSMMVDIYQEKAVTCEAEKVRENLSKALEVGSE